MDLRLGVVGAISGRCERSLRVESRLTFLTGKPNVCRLSSRSTDYKFEETDLLSKVISAAKAAWAIVTARQELALGNSQQAAATLEKAYSIVGDGCVLIEMDLLKAQIAIGTNDGPLALNTAGHALRRLRQGDGRYAVPDRAYLIGYAEELIHFCQTWRDQTPMIREARLIESSKVSAHLKANFPLTLDGRFVPTNSKS